MPSAPRSRRRQPEHPSSHGIEPAQKQHFKKARRKKQRLTAGWNEEYLLEILLGK